MYNLLRSEDSRFPSLRGRERFLLPPPPPPPPPPTHTHTHTPPPPPPPPPLPPLPPLPPPNTHPHHTNLAPTHLTPQPPPPSTTPTSRTPAQGLKVGAKDPGWPMNMMDEAWRDIFYSVISDDIIHWDQEVYFRHQKAVEYLCIFYERKHVKAFMDTCTCLHVLISLVRVPLSKPRLE